jgi:peptidoglycan/LPS O-acetylase OafA/YrhL
MSRSALTPPSPAGGPQPSAPVISGRLPFIDGLRGVAMLMVLVNHCWYFTVGKAIPLSIGRRQIDITAPLHFGYLGVHLFLLLSGFCLTYPLARRGPAGMRLELGRFARRRAWRILPPYYAALAGFILLRVLDQRLHLAAGGPDAPSQPLTAGNIISHLFMFHNLSPAWVGSINGSFWSLALEWQLYLVFPLLVWGFRRWGAARTVTASLALTLIYRTWVDATHDLSHLGAPHSVVYALPGRLFEFVLGMMAAVRLAGMREAPCRAWMRRYLAGAMALGLLGLCVTHWWSQYSPVTDAIWGLAFFCLVMYGGGWSAAGGGWLEWRPLAALGLISYSVYLIHEPLIQRASILAQARHFSATATLLLFELVVGPVLIGLGWLFFRLVESRSIRTGAPLPLPDRGASRHTGSVSSPRPLSQEFSA